MEAWKGTYLENLLFRSKELPRDFKRLRSQMLVLDQKAAGKSPALSTA